MESIDQLSRQLSSLGELRTIVKTMKALSAASIRQYEQAVRALGHYVRAVELGLQVVLKDAETGIADRRLDARDAGVVVFGSDHGLCGRFNEEVLHHALGHLRRLERNGSASVLFAVGARIASALAQEGRDLDGQHLLPGSASQVTGVVQQLLVTIDRWQADGRAATVYLCYNRHAEGSRYEPVFEQLLPIDRSVLRRLQQKPWPSRRRPTFTMDRSVLRNRLLHQYLFVSLFRACAESQASEHAARLAAMQSAERNLDERLEEVTMAHRRARQNAITSELLDVVSGFEAITGSRG